MLVPVYLFEATVESDFFCLVVTLSINCFYFRDKIFGTIIFINGVNSFHNNYVQSPVEFIIYRRTKLYFSRTVSTLLSVLYFWLTAYISDMCFNFMDYITA